MPSPTILTGLIVGAVLGFILQRGRFCITGAFRDLWVSRSWRWFTAFLLAIAVQAVGVAVLTSAGSITPEIPKLSVVATVVGSFLFGVGIVLAGGCATGTYYRAGEGLVGSWFALVAYATTAAASKTGLLSGVTSWVKGLWVTNLTTIPATIGLPSWGGVVILAGITGLVVHRFIVLERSRPAQIQLPAQRTGHPALHRRRCPHGDRRRLGRWLLHRQRPGADLAPVMAGLDRTGLPGAGGRGGRLVPPHPSPAASSRRAGGLTRARHRLRPRQNPRNHLAAPTRP